MEPVFKRLSDGSISLFDSAEARAVRRQKMAYRPPDPPEKVSTSARKAVLLKGGDPNNVKHLLGQHTMQFGIYRDKTFVWVLSNALGYAGFLVVSFEKEKPVGNHRYANKEAFARYMKMFAEGKEAILLKKGPVPNVPPPRQTIPTPVPTPIGGQPGDLGDEELLSGVLSVEAQGLEGSQIVGEASQAQVSTEAVLSTAVLVSESQSASEGFQSRATPETVSSTSVPVTESQSAGVTSQTGLVAPPVDLHRTVSSPSETEVVDPSRVSLVHEGFAQSLPTQSVSAPSTSFADPSRVSPVHEGFAQSLPTQSVSAPSTSFADTVPLPAGWKKTLPEIDHKWIFRALFRYSPSGGAECDYDRIKQLWWFPPQPSLSVGHPPALDRYFGHAFFLWMPRRLWKIKLVCPNETCDKIELKSSGLYQKIRRVVDVDRIYFMASEYLECPNCKKKLVSWSRDIIQQLDVGHQLYFPAVLTAKLACDLKVISLLRERGLGNSSSQIQKKLRVQHTDAWLRKIVQYGSDCDAFHKASQTGLIAPPVFVQPPPREHVPQPRWLMHAYAIDVMDRLPELKAVLTSQFGNILKLDSTKKVVKKLAGSATKTAMWCTNVGNEHGQVLNSVLTAGEGHGLTKMAQGLVARYRDAGVPPPTLVYVDRDCCSKTYLRKIFHGWEETVIRLDIWHFMRRLSTGCTTDSHPLYSVFMSTLSKCIFTWDRDDLQMLLDAKANELQPLTDREEIMKQLSRKELALHCRRTTRGEKETLSLMNQLLAAFSGPAGRDTLGVPLLNIEKMKEVWESQKKHVKCLQDPPDVQLYVQTGTLRKGGVVLPTYRCARGSTSLESFHLHLNRFIPGTTASATHFQAFLVEGLSRWNQDRGAEATSESYGGLLSYNGLLRHSANLLGEKHFGRKFIPYNHPGKYTGELIGIEYLYEQTGEVLQDLGEFPDVPENIRQEEDEEQEEEGQEEMQDFTVPLLDPDILNLTRVDVTPSPSSGVPSATLSPVSPRRTILHIPTEEEYREIGNIIQPVAPLEPVSNQPRQPRFETDQTVTSPVTAAPSGVTATQRGVTTTPSLVTATPSFVTATPSLVTATPSLVTATPSLVTATPTQVTATPHDPAESLGPGKIAGYLEVVQLSEYLVGLAGSSTALTNEQASHIILLWEKLSPHDKSPTVFAKRHQSQLSKGRYKATKRTVSPGVESTRRSFLGPNTGPAQWPDCNRYVETIVTLLCDQYPSSRKSESRWTLIGRAYNRIRQTIHNNPRVMAETNIQLPAINKTTLTQWYNRRGKRQDREMLVQGLSLPSPPMASSASLPAARSKPESLPTGNVQAHTFLTPPNTAGTASLPKRRGRPTKAPASSLRPLLPQPPLLILPSPVTAVTSTEPIPVSRVPYSTQHYRKRKADNEEKGVFKRPYKKTSSVYICKKCNKERNAPAHRQYYGNWYCAVTDTISFEDWKRQFVAKGYGKKS